MVKRAPRRDFRLNGKVYLMENEEVSEAVSAANQIIRLKCKRYKQSSKRTHSFFSVFRPDYLLEELTKHLTEAGQ